MAEPAPKSNSAGRITVGCKLPHGLVLQLERAEIKTAMNGAQEKTHQWIGERVILNGSNTSGIIGGYGITRDVDAEFFAAWVRQNSDEKGVPTFAPLKAGLIFAIAAPAAVEQEARNRATVRSGLEPLNPDAPGSKLTRVE